MAGTELCQLVIQIFLYDILILGIESETKVCIRLVLLITDFQLNNKHISSIPRIKYQNYKLTVSIVCSLVWKRNLSALGIVDIEMVMSL